MVSIADCPLLILVGLTGVGKTTTVKALGEAGLEMSPLPGRREVTDQRMIGYLQARAGEKQRPVTDRRERFDYTRRYRELFPGGMAHALTQIELEIESSPREGWLLFDGLRGRNEVEYAVRALPRAWFLVLHAPNSVRVERLLNRADSFDQIAGEGGLASVDELLSSHREVLLDGGERLKELVSSGQVTLEELRGKLSIVAKEHENYSAEETLAALERNAAERTIEARTDQLSPGDIAGRVVAAVRGAEAR